MLGRTASNVILRASRATGTAQAVKPLATYVGRRRLLSCSCTWRDTATGTARSTTASSAKQHADQQKRSPSTPPTELLTVLEETIKTHGPLPVSRYMTLCLAHPTLGYYTTRKVFGLKGDFITSPEISQIFGELLAIWYVTQWAAQGASSKVRIVELGPGRGTLLTDILRTFRSLPKHSSPPVSSIHLVENSDALRLEQKTKLEQLGFGSVSTEWYANVEEVPQSEDEFTVVVAHEFFDALPIHIFENTPKGWREVLVDVANPKDIIVSSKPREPLRLVLAPGPTPASTLYTRLSTIVETPAASTSSSSSPLDVDTTLPPAHAPTAPHRQQSISPTLSRFARLPVGSRMEISPASWEVARGMGQLLSGRAGGAGLVVDYGDAKAFGRSWRGFRKHQVVDPLSEPGHTDLTANVDFSYISEALGDLATSHGPLPQSTFLNSLGLMPRLAGLLKAAQPERKKEIESAAKRLVDATGMGSQYKILGLTPKGVQEGQCFPFVADPPVAAGEAQKG